MYEQSAILWLIVVTLIIVAVLVIVYFSRKRARSDNAVVPVSTAAELSTPLESETPQPLLVELPRFIINPLEGLSFEDSIQPDRLSRGIKMNVSGAMRQSLQNYGGDVGNGILQITALENSGLVVSFDDQGYKLVRSADGVYKAVSRESGGAFHEVAAVDVFGTWINIAAHTSSLIVTVAHLISNADISRRLADVQHSVGKLLEYREIDTLADIRTTYESLREEMGKVDLQSDNVTRYRVEFRRNRHRLFGDAMAQARRLEPLYQSGLLNRIRQQFKKSAKLQARASELEEIRKKLTMAAYCLQMESLAACLCASEKDQQILRQEAAKEWRKIAKVISPFEEEVNLEYPLAIPLQNMAKVWCTPECELVKEDALLMLERFNNDSIKH